VRYIGVGEGADDLRVFSADEFVDGMLAGELPTEGGSPLSERGRVRRRRRVGDDSGDGSAEVGDTAEALPRRAAEGSGE
ncbi:MAG: hypothetical protein IT290_08665, partial [Deltaproteobacteria bacterium]|nr:hypothetical protein [Deltaproteobacteria bacterium]